MNDLQSLLRDLEAGVAASSAGEPEFSHVRTKRTVRRKRTTRAVGVGAAGVVAAGTLGVGVWSVAGRANEGMASAVSPSATQSSPATPTATPSPTASPTPTPTPSPTPSAAASPLTWTERGSEDDPKWALTRIDYPLPEGAGDVTLLAAGTRGPIDIVAAVEKSQSRIEFFEVRGGEWFLIAFPARQGDASWGVNDQQRIFLDLIPGSTLDTQTHYADFEPPADPASGFYWWWEPYSFFQDLAALPADLAAVPPADTASALTEQVVRRPITGEWIPDGLTVTAERHAIAGPAGLSRFGLATRNELTSFKPLPVLGADYLTTTLSIVSGVSASDLVDSGYVLADGRRVLTPVADSPLMHMVSDAPGVDEWLFDAPAPGQASGYYTTTQAEFSLTTPSVLAVPTGTPGTYEVWAAGSAVPWD